jgi:hypothetical protein
MSTPDGTWKDTVTFANDTILKHDVNTILLTNTLNTTISGNGLILEATRPIRASFSIENSANAFFMPAKGEKALGTSFYVITNPTGGASTGSQEVHFATIMATEDNTMINLDNDGNGFYQGTASGLLSVTIDAGESYMVVSDPNDSDFFQYLSITADKPVAVVAGETHVSIQSSGILKEGGITQFLPISELGKEFIVSRGEGTANDGDFLLVLALTNNTDIFVNGSGSPITTLNGGAYYRVEMSGSAGTPYYINTNEDVYAIHYSTILGEEVGAAFVPPVDKILGSKYVELNKADMDDNACYVVIENSGLSVLKWNGQAYTTASTATTVTGKSNYSVVYFEEADYNTGLNTIEADIPFFVGQLAAESIFGSLGSGWYDFISNFNGPVEVVDGTNPKSFTTFYIADTVELGASVNHPVTIHSLVGSNSIQSVLSTGGIAGFSGSNLSYTAPSDFCGCDMIDVTVKDGSNNTKTVQIGFLIDLSQQLMTIVLLIQDYLEHMMY